MVELNEFGRPVNPKIPCFRMEGKVGPIGRVKDHPTWKNEKKPWANYIHHSAKMHSSVECHYMYLTAKELGSGDYVSLGAFKGLSTACMAYGLKEGGHTGKVYGVDLFNHYHPLEPGLQLKMFNDGMEAAGLQDYAVACEGYTHHWAHKLRKLKFKFILIDADHHYETCKMDWEKWSLLLADDGLIAFHDVDMVPVDMVISEIDASKWKQVDLVHRLRVFARR
ncbi:MAG: class I SAM-dependent methyltransferase [Nitrososphaera sp.]|nr:class I SAM-dependent methyltransferase [Nitrososphaera sp.]